MMVPELVRNCTMRELLDELEEEYPYNNFPKSEAIFVALFRKISDRLGPEDEE